MNIHWIVFFTILGGFIGSFLNVCIFRLPRGESIVFPPSHCPNCNTRLAPLDLIPIISFFFLKRKCRYCKSGISGRYPLVEAITAGAFGVLAFKIGDGASFSAAQIINLLKYLLFAGCLIVVFFIDLDTKLIYDIVILPLIPVGLLIGIVDGSFFDKLLAAVIGFSIFLFIAVVGSAILKQDAMGGGDIKFAVVLGTFLGIKLFFVGMFLAFLFGAVISISLLILRRRKMREEIPFGPMMSIGSFIAVIYGAELIDWYLNLWKM